MKKIILIFAICFALCSIYGCSGSGRKILLTAEAVVTGLGIVEFLLPTEDKNKYIFIIGDETYDFFPKEFALNHDIVNDDNTLKQISKRIKLREFEEKIANDDMMCIHEVLHEHPEIKSFNAQHQYAMKCLMNKGYNLSDVTYGGIMRAKKLAN